MRSILDIWESRLNAYIKEVRTYLRYMLNDHLLFVMIFVVGGGAYWYQGWLKNIPSHFPSAFVMAILLTFTVTFAYVRTLLKEPDIVFLLPLEKRLQVYLQKAFVFSFISQLYPIIIVFVILVPLYVREFDVSGSELILLFFVMLILKMVNQFVQWKLTYFPDRTSQISDFIVRFTLNFLFIYFFVTKNYLFSSIVIIIFAIYTYYFTKVTKHKPLKWQFLIDEENRRLHNFYRIANLFTDVPKLKNQVKRRKWLDWILTTITYKQSNTFFYLYARSFLRAGDYFGIYIRLLLIALFITFTIPLSFIGGTILAALMIFSTGIQIVSMYKQYHNLTIPSLYPVGEDVKKKSFLTLLFIILTIQEMLLTIVLFIDLGFVNGLLQFFINIILAYLFVYFYVAKRFIKS